MLGVLAKPLKMPNPDDSAADWLHHKAQTQYWKFWHHLQYFCHPAVILNTVCNSTFSVRRIVRDRDFALAPGFMPEDTVNAACNMTSLRD